VETVACNLCGSTDHRFAYRLPDELYHPDEWFSVVACAGCGLGFVNPRPAFEEMGRYYPAAFYQFFDEDRAFQERRYAIEASFLDGVPPGRLLDVGCANGDFPRFMRTRGWSVEGVEVSANSKAIDDFPVYRQAFPAIPVDEPRYDAVTAWAVLEHVHDPMAYFRKVGRVLRPGGRFAFLVTNFDSLASRRLYREDVPRHLYFFTEATVRRFLDAAGLAFERAEYSDRIYPMMPIHWTRHLLARARGRDLQFDELPPTRVAWLARRGLQASLAGNLRWAAANPLVVADRIVAPLIGRLEMLTRRYGIVTYSARRR
jgi:SAM-dependent methyltransferase